jgi:ATP-dependent helicase/nuclease subunit A
MAYLKDKADPCDIGQFLLITYTRAAAGEMRARIIKELGAYIKENPGDAHMRRQAAAAHTSPIGTLHSYCMELYREFYAQAGLPAGLRLCDEAESALLRARACDLALEAWFETGGGDADGAADLERMGVTMRGDRRLAETVQEVWKRTAEGAEAALPDPAGREVWESELVSIALNTLSLWKERLAAVDSSARNDAAMLLGAAKRGWNALTQALCAVKSPSAKRKKDWEARDETLHFWGARLEWLKKTFCVTAEEGEEDALATLPAARALLGAVKLFGRMYEEEKEIRRVMDYKDLEKFAVKILSDAETAAVISSRFREIMVDEYQDINPPQDEIVSLLSRGGRNVFYVGDIRQSIYRFQRAEPGIFLEKYESFPPWPDAPRHGPVRVALKDNFRSRPEIIEAVNRVFSKLMRRESGEVTYDEPMRPGRTWPPDAQSGTEWLVCAGNEEYAVAKRLKELIDAGTRPEDCVILLRSPKKRAGAFRAALERLGIEARQRDDSADWLAAPEITALTALLTVTDNPLQDIPLLALLRAPLYAFDSGELAALRAGDPKARTIYACLRAARTEKSEKVLNDLREWRFLAAEWPVWRLAARMAARLAPLFGGDAQRNLDAFAEMASTAPASGLPGFLGWLAQMAESGRTALSPRADPRGAVRIMSIHAAKGLEFPVVVLANLDRAFNLRDGYAPVLAHEGALALRRNDGTAEYPTPPHRLLAARMAWQSKAEELRLLYVAMTRAERLLILSHAESSPESWLSLWNSRDEDTRYSAQDGRCFADWLRVAGSPDWRVRVCDGELPEESPEEAADTSYAPPDITYAHEKSVSLPSKMTFGEMKGRFKDAEAFQDTEGEKALRPFEYSLPSFESRQGMTPAQRGSAAHLVLQWARLENCETPESAKAEIERLTESSLVTPEQAACITPQSLSRLAVSSVGRRAARAERIYRECKFSFLEDARALLGEEGEAGEQILLQGVIDCFFKDGQGWAALDFKTDNIRPGQGQERARAHRQQLEFYARAVRKLTGAESVEMWVCFLSTGETVRLP